MPGSIPTNESRETIAEVAGSGSHVNSATSLAHGFRHRLISAFARQRFQSVEVAAEAEV